MAKRISPILLLVTALPGSAFADSWTLEPWLSSLGQYQSNAALISGDELDGYSAQLQGGIEARVSSATTSFYLTPSFYATQFFDNDLDSLDTESYFVDTGVDHTLQRAELGLRVRLSERPAYQSELDEAIPVDPNDPLPSGGGELTVRDDTQTSVEAQPRWSYQVSEKDTLEVNGRYLDVGYDAASVDTSRFDYRDTQVGAEWTHELSLRHSVLARIDGGEYRAESSAPGTESDSKYVALGLGYEWRVSELNTLAVNAGLEENDIRLSDRQLCTDPDDIAAGIACEDRDEVTSFTGDVNWHYRGARYDLRLGVGSSVNPTSRGTQQKRNQARMLVSREFTSRVSARFGIVAYRQESLDDQSDFQDDYVTTEIGADWKLTKTISATASYRYFDRKSENDGSTLDDFDNNMVSLGLTWDGARW